MATDAATTDKLLGLWDAAAGPEGVDDGGDVEAVESATPTRAPDGKFTKGGVDATETPAGDGKTKGVADRSTDPKAPGAAAPAVRPNGSAQRTPVAGVGVDSANGAAETPAELADLAKKHGFVVVGGKVVPRERHAFREERRVARAELQTARQQFDAERERTVAQLRNEGSVVYAAAQRLKAKDYDGFAQALGKKDWNDLNGEVINQHADPNYLEIQELKRDKLAREQQIAQQTQQHQQRQAQQQEAQAQTEYKQGLAASMAESTDPFVVAMADDPGFVNAVFRIQEAHFDGVETISVEDAVRLKPRNGGSALLDELRGLYQRLHRSGAFAETDDSDRGTQTARPATKQAAAGTPRGPAKKATTTISQKDAQEATGAVDPKNKDQFFRYALSKLNAADKSADD